MAPSLRSAVCGPAEEAPAAVVFRLPAGVRRLIEALRTRKGHFEDAVFGFRAAGEFQA